MPSDPHSSRSPLTPITGNFITIVCPLRPPKKATRPPSLSRSHIISNSKLAFGPHLDTIWVSFRERSALGPNYL